MLCSGMHTVWRAVEFSKLYLYLHKLKEKDNMFFNCCVVVAFWFFRRSWNGAVKPRPWEVMKKSVSFLLMNQPGSKTNDGWGSICCVIITINMWHRVTPPLAPSPSLKVYSYIKNIQFVCNLNIEVEEHPSRMNLFLIIHKFSSYATLRLRCQPSVAL